MANHTREVSDTATLDAPAHAATAAAAAAAAAAAETAATIAALIDAFTPSGVVNAGYAAYVLTNLTELREQYRRRQRLLALDIRHIAIRGIPGDEPPLPPAAL